jgi:hypothetical protein
VPLLIANGLRLAKYYLTGLKAVLRFQEKRPRFDYP